MIYISDNIYCDISDYFVILVMIYISLQTKDNEKNVISFLLRDFGIYGSK